MYIAHYRKPLLSHHSDEHVFVILVLSPVSPSLESTDSSATSQAAAAVAVLVLLLLVETKVVSGGRKLDVVEHARSTGETFRLGATPSRNTLGCLAHFLPAEGVKLFPGTEIEPDSDRGVQLVNCKLGWRTAV